MTIVLSQAQRQEGESLLATLNELQSARSGALAALNQARELHGRIAANAANARKSTDPSDSKAVLELLALERALPMQAEVVTACEKAYAEATEKLDSEMMPVPDFLQAALSPALAALVEEIAHQLLPQFKDKSLASNAARQTERVRRFHQWLGCAWKVSSRVVTAPAAIKWCDRLLAGQLPEELE
jgi:hypothetical protein